MANDVMSKRLKQLRQDKGVLQEELSVWLSVSRTSYPKWTGKRQKRLLIKAK